MTINELVENLRKWEYPALPSPITLYQYLKKATTENRTFEVGISFVTIGKLTPFPHTHTHPYTCTHKNVLHSQSDQPHSEFSA